MLKGHPLIEPLKKVIQIQIECGFVEKYYYNVKNKITYPHDHLTSMHPLTLNELKHGFILLLIGLGLASAIFVCELYVRACKSFIKIWFKRL